MPTLIKMILSQTELLHHAHEPANEHGGGDIDADKLGDQYIESNRYQHVKHQLEAVPRNEELIIAVFTEQRPEKNNNARNTEDGPGAERKVSRLGPSKAHPIPTSVTVNHHHHADEEDDRRGDRLRSVIRQPDRMRSVLRLFLFHALPPMTNVETERRSGGSGGITRIRQDRP